MAESVARIGVVVRCRGGFVFAKPNCCAAPQLVRLRQCAQPPGPVIGIYRCQSCHTDWQRETEDRMNFDGGEDDYFERYVKLSKAEAGRRLARADSV